MFSADQPLRFGVLGPLEVADDQGEPLAVSSTKLRTVLAVLLFHANQVVSVDQLVELVWNGEPPKSARTNLQVYIHRLRQVLGEPRIPRRSPGYLLVVRPGELDVERFEELVAAGRPAEALRLWRGDAYSGLDQVEELRTEAVRLEELRLVALENRIEADLDAGEQAALVAELTTLTASHPLREGFRAQLMLALYRSGQGAAALEVYQDVERTLIDELGVEPGARLRQLEQAIRAGDPALKRTQEEPSKPAAKAAQDSARQPARQPNAPAELPPASAIFTGRHVEVANVAKWLGESPEESGCPRFVAIAGPGGAGKSALAMHAAHSVAEAFPDGQLYVNLHGATPGLEPMAPGEVLARFLRAFGWSSADIPSDLDEAAAAFRTQTADRRILVVLDNAADATQVRPLLPGGGESAVLVTSRAVLSTLDGARQLLLESLSEDEAVVLFARLVGPERTAAEPDAVAEIVQLCDRLPLAIRIAGARLAARPAWPPSALAERLRDAHHRLDELEYADLALRTSIAVSRQALRPSAARLYALLGGLALPDFTPHVAAALADRPFPEIWRGLDELVQSQLMQPAGGERYVFHDLIRLDANEQAANTIPEPERTEAVRRVLLHYLATVRTATAIFDPGNAPRRMDVGVPNAEVTQAGTELAGHEAWTWIDAERANLTSAVGLARRSGPGGEPIAVALAAALFACFAGRGYWAELVAANRELLDLADIRPAEFAAVHQDLGIAYQEVGRTKLGMDHLERLVEAVRESGDQLSEVTGLTGLGIAWLRLGEPDLAAGYLTQARELCRARGDRNREARVLNNLGSVALVRERYDDAEAIYTDVLTLYRELGDGRGEGIALQNLGETYLRAGRPEAAVAALEQSALLQHQAGLRSNEPTTFWALGDAHHALGQLDQARAHWREALSILCEDGKLAREEMEAILADPVPNKPLLRH